LSVRPFSKLKTRRATRAFLTRNAPGTQVRSPSHNGRPRHGRARDIGGRAGRRRDRRPRRGRRLAGRRVVGREDVEKELQNRRECYRLSDGISRETLAGIAVCSRCFTITKYRFERRVFKIEP